MSFVQFFRILWARRAIVLTSLLGCFLAALLMAKILPERFDAKSRVMLDIVKPDPVTGEVIASQFARAFVKTQIELIRDYRVAGKVADSFGWTSSPELAAQYRQSGEADSLDFRRWLAQRVIDRTSVQLIEGSNILEITYASTSPENAAKVADAIRQAYIDQTLAFRRDAAARNAAWFKNQIKKIQVDLTAAEKRKTDFEKANGILLQDDNVDTEMTRLKALAASAPSAPVTIPAAPAAPVVSASAGQLAAIDAAIANASKTLGPNHPELQNLRNQRAAVAAAAGREMAAARSVGRPAVVSGPSIGAMYSAQQAKVLAQRGKVAEAQQLASDVNLLKEQVSKTAARAAELEQEAQATETGLTVLGNAVAPLRPAFPNLPLVIFGSLGLGLALGILVSLLVELLSRRVRGPEDMLLHDIPLIGVMAVDSSATKRSGILDWFGFRSWLPSRA